MNHVSEHTNVDPLHSFWERTNTSQRFVFGDIDSSPTLKLLRDFDARIESKLDFFRASMFHL